jgi:hypothetical protein
MRIAWQVLRWPLFAFLVVFEPIVGPGHHPLVQVRPRTSTKPTRISGLLPSVVRGGTVESKLIHPLCRVTFRLYHILSCAIAFALSKLMPAARP